MINLYLLDRYRLRGKAVAALWGWEGDDTCGAFEVPSPVDRAALRVIASCGSGWDHVSVSRQNRCPNWKEMSHIARLFFRPDEVAVQYHVPQSEHVNMMETCLHWWRWQGGEIPRPPSTLVGVGDRPARDLQDAKAMMREAGLEN